MSSRPDPITSRVTWLVGVLTALGVVIPAVIDGLELWNPPTENTVIDWARSLSPVILGVIGAVAGARAAKKHTTPLSDPRTDTGEKLVPASMVFGSSTSAFQAEPPL